MSPSLPLRATVAPRGADAGCAVGNFGHTPGAADLLGLLMLLAGLACLRRRGG